MDFEVAAEAYDSFMGRWSVQLAPGMADLAEVRPGTSASVLDVGCGTGSLTAELVRRVNPAAVAAIDPSAAMVATTQARYPGVDVRQATAAELPFDGDQFDAAIAQLVIHFMPDPIEGLREMRRVTRPGGTVATCVWDYAGGRDPLGVFWEAARVVDPAVHDESDLPGAGRGRLAALLTAAGFSEIIEIELNASRTFPDVATWWAPFTAGVGPAGRYLARLDAELQIALRAECERRLPDGPVTVDAIALAAMGRA